MAVTDRVSIPLFTKDRSPMRFPGSIEALILRLPYKGGVGTELK